MNLKQIIAMDIPKGSPIEINKGIEGIERVYYVGSNYNNSLGHDQIMFRRIKEGDICSYLLPYVNGIKKLKIS